MLQKLTLSKPWLEHPAGSEVEVDPERLAWLRENGFDAEHPVEAPVEVERAEAEVLADERPRRRRAARAEESEE
jgi:hypothetical protein